VPGRLRQTQRDYHLLKLFFDRLQMLDDALSRGHRDARKWRMFGYPRLRDRVMKGSQIICGSADDK
jgi:hypothetical protein